MFFGSYLQGTFIWRKNRQTSYKYLLCSKRRDHKPVTLWAKGYGRPQRWPCYKGAGDYKSLIFPQCLVCSCLSDTEPSQELYSEVKQVSFLTSSPKDKPLSTTYTNISLPYPQPVTDHSCDLKASKLVWDGGLGGMLKVSHPIQTLV